MELIYKIKVVEGFDGVKHPEEFFKRWLQKGSHHLFAKAKMIINGGEGELVLRTVCRHGSKPEVGWQHLGCLGYWHRGCAVYADSHCLEVFRDPNGRFFLVDQSEHGDFSGHFYASTVVCEIPV